MTSKGSGAAKIAATSKLIAKAIAEEWKFGDRVVLAELPRRDYEFSTMAIVQVRCACGHIGEVPWSSLLAGRSQRCFDCAMRKRWGR